MITTFDQVDIIFQRLIGSGLPGMISGGIYKQRRPAGSKKEDIVINSLPVANGQLQTGIVNVNIHVPNLVVKVNGVQDSSQPDLVKLNDLTVAVIAVLSDVWSENYRYDVQQQMVIEDEEAQDHYSNIRIEFFSYNLTN